MTIINSLGVTGLNVVAVDGSLGFGRNAMNLLWDNLLGHVPKPNPERVSTKIGRRENYRQDEIEVKQAVNATQIGMLLTFDGVQFAQAHDRSEHRFSLTASDLKMHADYLVSDFKTVMEYELQNFTIETLEEEANEAVKNETI